MESKFWKDKKTLITGHTGFKGSWLVLYLDALGADLYGYALEPETRPSFYQEANLDNLMAKSCMGDINDLDILTSFFKETNPSVLFHMAAQPIVRESFLHPIETFETNIIGTAKVIKAALECDSLEAIVVITSDKCYKNQEKSEGYKENDPLGGDDPYSASKACAEIVSQSLRSSFLKNKLCKLATVRAGNVIGGGDWAKDRLIPDCINAFSRGELLSLRNPKAIRPWQHVLEPLTGYLHLTETLCKEDGEMYSDAWNFGPNLDSQKSVEEVVGKISYLWGETAKWQQESDDLNETNLLFLDNSKACKHLNWKPILDLQETIEMTVSWYQSFLSGQNCREISINQLNNYLVRANK